MQTCVQHILRVLPLSVASHPSPPLHPPIPSGHIRRSNDGSAVWATWAARPLRQALCDPPPPNEELFRPPCAPGRTHGTPQVTPSLDSATKSECPEPG